MQPRPNDPNVPATTAADDPAIVRLAFELHAELDVARHAVRGLRATYDQPGPPAVEDVIGQLDRLDTTLGRLHDFIRRAMHHDATRFGLMCGDMTLHDEINHVVHALAPDLERGQIALFIDIDDELARQPGGVLGPIILQGVRNAMQACSTDGLSQRRIDVSVHRTSVGGIDLCIADTGPGLGDEWRRHADLHGHGVLLCRQLVEGIGGSLRFMNAPFNRGAVFRISIPPTGWKRVG
ncbi:MAG: HAMP domain-containing histidine kinase [Phycisphaerales bacterium]|nr:HAMP domain-containing histidine kinase [Phycisphaerales bacterium]